MLLTERFIVLARASLVFFTWDWAMSLLTSSVVHRFLGASVLLLFLFFDIAMALFIYGLEPARRDWMVSFFLQGYFPHIFIWGEFFQVLFLQEGL